MAEKEDRTEQGTARKREKAREQGQLPRSRELVSMATTGGILIVLFMTGHAFMQNVGGMTGRLLSLHYGRDPIAVMRAAGTETMVILAPFFAVAVIVAIAANLAQGGFLMKPLKLQMEVLNPFTGLKRIFSAEALPGMAKSLFKFVVGIILFYVIIKKIILFLPMTSAMDIPGIQEIAFALTAKAVIYTFGTFFVIALADYFYERWKFERSIRMSKEEIREETRESEGDPLIKAKIKSMQREMARRRMMEAVPKATVVITNPTHIAVALLYHKDKTAAPRVVAKGKGYIAETIRALARKNGVPLVEDKPLARSLFKVKLDSDIPADLYRAVAKILAYIYKLKGVAA